MSARATVTHDGSTWDVWDYGHGLVILQRECERCDRGLLLSPVRFCPECVGTGYIVRTAGVPAEATP